MADEERRWSYPYVWRRPEGYPFTEEDIDEHYEGSDDYLVNTSDWASYIWCPAEEHIQVVKHWPSPIESLLDWLSRTMSNDMSLATEFDAPRIARTLKQPIPTILAARDTLIRLRVIWFNPRAFRGPLVEDDALDAWQEFAQIGINFRFQKWITDCDTIQDIWREESDRFNHVRTRPQEAQRHLRRDAIPNDLRWQIYARDKFTCRYCGESGVPLALDHLIPILRGGTNDLENLVTSCQSCNSRKGAQWPEER